MKTNKTLARTLGRSGLMAVIFLVALFNFRMGEAKASGNDHRREKTEETAVFAGGCFWGMEGIFERLKGVRDVVSGYAGGEKATAKYDKVSSGSTGHAESIQVEFDPGIISFRALLEVFFKVAHDPTELNYQGPDVGSQYRSEIFAVTEAQKRTADEYIRELNQKRIYAKPVVTKISRLKEFFPAESYHQNFMDRNPSHPYIVQWDLPKIRLLKQKFPDLLAAKP